MKLKSNQRKDSAERVVQDIRRATRRHYSIEDKIRIVLSGLRGEDSIAELYRKQGIPSLPWIPNNTQLPRFLTPSPTRQPMRLEIFA
jgi:hypothetical protein